MRPSVSPSSWFSSSLLRVSVWGSVALLAGALSGCADKKAAAGEPPPRTVSAATVISRDVPRYLDAVGQMTAFESVNIVAQVDGQIVELPFTQGSLVKKGDKLAVIYQPPYEAALEEAKGLLAADQASLKLAQSQLERSRPLLSGNFVSQQAFDSYTSQVDQLMGKIDVDEAHVKTAQINYDYTTIRAPTDGMVGNYKISIGNVVKAQSEVLTTIQRMDPIYADFVISVDDFPRLRDYFDKNAGKLKMLATDLADPSRAREGELTILANAIAPLSGTAALRATVANTDRFFWPNEPVHVRVFLDTLPNAVLVPESAVQLSQQGAFVFVVAAAADGKPLTVEKRVVQAGQTQDDGMTVINSGLKTGEQVVVHGQIFLQPGSAVKVMDLDGQPVGAPASAPAAPAAKS